MLPHSQGGADEGGASGTISKVKCAAIQGKVRKDTQDLAPRRHKTWRQEDTSRTWRQEDRIPNKSSEVFENEKAFVSASDQLVLVFFRTRSSSPNQDVQGKDRPTMCFECE
jgi:hypothetical protein